MTKLNNVIKDLTGKTFGNLTAIRPLKIRVSGSIVWLCKCKCGKNKKVSSHSLSQGFTKSCGERRCQSNFKDLTGKLFGKLTVISLSSRKNSWGKKYWKCKCICGKTVNILSNRLSSGDTKSCGCIKRKNQYETIKNNAYRRHIKSSKKRGIKSYLSQEEYIGIASKVCYYCGEINIKKNVSTKNTILLNGIDRKNNELFYKLENSVPCCKICNFMKNNTSYEDFLLKISKIYSRLNLSQEANIKFDQ
jgi:hypothetical protein